MKKNSPEAVRAKIGARIKKERKARKLTRYMLAKLADIGETQLKRIEDGAQNAKIDTISKLFEVLEIELQV